MSTANVLVVEDEELMRAILRQLFEAEGYRVFTADSARSALDLLGSNNIDLTVTDIKMPGMDGLGLLGEIKLVDPDAQVIIITAYSSVDTAIGALRRGAYDYVTKPFVNEDLLQRVRNAIEHRRLFRENRQLRREIKRQYNFSEMIGTSDALRSVFDIIHKVADTSANVLIQGESGTGKELIARSVHFNSGRSDQPFLAVNCGALPESLLESELFGHRRGSFTGAVADAKGLFRSAASGTLFLDEIGEMPASLQVKVLRALQEHEVMPVGASAAVPFDARIIAATNKDLEQEVAVGRFRKDLYYRLNVVEITVPPLRSRRDDIPLLARHFAAKAARDQGTEPKGIEPAALSLLCEYDWPGNIRELEHVIERAVILSNSDIDVESLPDKVRLSKGGSGGSEGRTLEEVERGHIMSVLRSVGNDKVRAADELGIDLSTLYRKLKRYEATGGYLEESSSTK